MGTTASIDGRLGIYVRRRGAAVAGVAEELSCRNGRCRQSTASASLAMPGIALLSRLRRLMLTAATAVRRGAARFPQE